MSELAKTVDVADGIDSGNVGLHVLIDGNATTSVCHTNIIEVDGFEVCTAAYSHEHKVAFERLKLALLFVFHTHWLAFEDGFGSGTHMETDAALLE